ncbi:acyl-CoA thioesterase [Streptomyces sp. NPDC059740]|uniref:acyl-CoA thioesterase n=1 Tax=Streptomyces sp. NPDC059740 TaxID=3346926 RepID=UPI003646DCBA
MSGMNLEHAPTTESTSDATPDARPGCAPDRPFRVRLTVRHADLDTNGHVRGSAYVDFADHARWACLQEAGVDPVEMSRSGLGPVNLRTTIDFHRELRAGDESVVTCTFTYEGGEKKTGRATQELRRTDGTLVATVESVFGLLDLTTRRLVPDPASHWRRLATTPCLLGAD